MPKIIPPPPQPKISNVSYRLENQFEYEMRMNSRRKFKRPPMVWYKRFIN